MLSQSTVNPLSECLYTCFNSGNYIGRSGQDITVTSLPQSTNNHTIGITFWWGYVGLTALTLITNEKGARAPKIARKTLFSWHPFWRGEKDPQSVDGLALVRRFTQLASVAAYIGSIFREELEHANSPAMRANSEPFSAVGQWGSIAVVGLVLVAAVVSKTSQNSTPAKQIGDSKLATDEQSLTEPWDHSCGYASWGSHSFTIKDDSIDWAERSPFEDKSHQLRLTLVGVVVRANCANC